LLTKVIEVLNEEFDVLTATGAQHGESVVQSTPFDVVITAHPLRDGSGIALLKEAMLRNPDTTCFLLSTRAGSKAASQGMREANLTPRVLFEPLDPADVLAKARTVLTLTRMREAAAKLQGRRATASDP
jgi:DNA-binding NtrC family response regulator